MGIGYNRERDRSPRSSYRLEPFPVDVSDRGEEFVLAAALPGLAREAITVQARRNSVEIAADLRGRDEWVPRGARDPETVRRRIALADAVDKRSASATYLDGVLFVRVRKRHPPAAEG